MVTQMSLEIFNIQINFFFATQKSTTPYRIKIFFSLLDG